MKVQGKGILPFKQQLVLFQIKTFLVYWIRLSGSTAMVDYAKSVNMAFPLCYFIHTHTQTHTHCTWQQACTDFLFTILVKW
jgi:hypothetical protein